VPRVSAFHGVVIYMYWHERDHPVVHSAEATSPSAAQWASMPGGIILYAGSMSALPADLARALVSAGAVTAMEPDINAEWVQADTAPSPGGLLSAAVLGQHRRRISTSAAGHGTT
jgi:hypothetical protein